MLRSIVCAVGISVAGVCAAQVDVKAAWARPAVQGQSGTGAFMTLTAPQGAKLIGASSSVAGVTEIHEMAMEGNMMKMRAIQFLELPAGRAVELKPGGYHVMLMDLKRPLKAGERIIIDVRIETADGKRATLPVEVEVRARAPEGAPADRGAHKR
jgi:copper(I)-binding protein